jgi:hypothetical protein
VRNALSAALLLLAPSFAGCAAASRGIASPVTLVIPPPVEGPAAPPSSEPPRERPEPRITGEWLEEFGEGRQCSDRIRITGSGGRLAIDSKNCAGGNEYTFDEIAYDGHKLAVRLSFVPENGSTILYHLEWGAKGALEGSADVTNGEGSTSYHVRWHRP